MKHYVFTNYKRWSGKEIEDYFYNPYVKIMDHDILVFHTKEDMDFELFREPYWKEITKEEAIGILGGEEYLAEGNLLKDYYKRNFRVVNEWKPCEEVRKIDA